MSIVYAQKNLTDDTADAFESFVEILLSGLDTVSFQLAGTWTGTVTFESTTDGDTYASLSVTPSTGAAAVTTATGNGIWAADGCAGFYSVRARCSTFGSGVIIASAGAGANSVAAVANASDGQVLFMDGTQPSGDSGLTWDPTTREFTVTGNTAGFSDSAIVTGSSQDNLNSWSLFPGGLDISRYQVDASAGTAVAILYEHDADTGDMTGTAETLDLRIDGDVTGGHTIEALAALRITKGVKHGAGTITNNYAIKIGDVDAGATNYAIQTGTGLLSWGDVEQLKAFAFGSLPTGAAGMMAYVNNCSTQVWGATADGAGAFKVLTWFNGTNWTVIGK